MKVILVTYFVGIEHFRIKVLSVFDSKQKVIDSKYRLNGVLDFHFPLSDRNFSCENIRERNDKSSNNVRRDSVALRKFVIESVYRNKEKR